MIKFFRKIRYDLMEKNKTGKYFKYAIGEIVLVVIGILIALQINNWNELTKKRNTEIEILVGIRNDILRDTIDINFNIRGYQNIIKRDSFVLHHLIKKKAYSNMFAQNLHSIANLGWSVVLHEAHFQEAKQRGLSIISNKEIRNEINYLYGFKYSGFKSKVNNNDRYKHNELLKHTIGNYFSYDSSGVFIDKESYAKLLSNKNSHYYIKRSSDMHKRLLNFHFNTLSKSIEVAQLIEKEIVYLKNKY
ncbi:DUF6090 family protein [Winogradskyella vincentii]|uniref:Uncharacterized protein n=1 Tax=Winogradskyella vincentii TaxID=2877122 RepID=A0ABS7Y3L3_9FLAO|nr:DUF6090 family protein [Winogradskyella vincentii]MCA0154524.1 hypothetical protein [Winogradskyella vincentii]